MNDMDVDDDLEMLPDDIFDNFDTNTKCGEIFVTKGELNYLCTFCSNIFSNLQTFSEHLFQAHQLFNFEPMNNNSYNGSKCFSSSRSKKKEDNSMTEVTIPNSIEFGVVHSTTDATNSSATSSSISADSFHASDANDSDDCRRKNDISTVNFDNIILNLDHQIINSSCVYLQHNDEFNNDISTIESYADKDLLLIETNISETNSKSDIEVQYENNNGLRTNNTIIKSNLMKKKQGMHPKDCREKIMVTTTTTTYDSMSTKPFRCEICNKRFATVKNMKNHQDACADRAHLLPYACKFCPRRFYVRRKCERHQQIKHSSELNPGIPKGFWKCQICHKLLRNTCSRKKHEDGHFLLTDKNGKKSQCSCEVCGKVLSSSASLKVHMRIHNEENRFKCAFCPARFKFSTSLKTHELSHTGERQFQCRYCDKRFLQNSHRKNHEILHNKEKKLECIHCRMKFHRMDYLNSHIKNKHSNDKQRNSENNRPYQCKFCQSSFTAEKYLKNHERLHVNGVEYKCKYCDKTSIVKGIIERHEKTHLKTKETFPCHLCTKQFESKNGLISHVKIKHPDNNVLEYKCGKCETQFQNSSDLQEHIRKVCSIVVKSFGCDKCSARFELEHGLKVHKAVTHIIVDPIHNQKG